MKGGWQTQKNMLILYAERMWYDLKFKDFVYALFDIALVTGILFGGIYGNMYILQMCGFLMVWYHLSS